GLAIERRPCVRRQSRAVEVEEHAVTHVGNQVLLAARNGTRGRRRGARAGRGAGVLVRARRKQGDGGQHAENLAVHFSSSLIEGGYGRQASEARATVIRSARECD